MRRPKRILGYARVSSAEQAIGTSLQDQQEVIRQHAKTKCGIAVARMFVEAESAVHEKIERREQIRALMADVREGDLVLVDKIDRWSRDPEFTYASVRQILARGASFYAIGDDCDPSTPHGDSMMGFRIFFAREEHKRIRLRTVGTRKALRDRGYYVEGVLPWGYKRPEGVRGVERHVLVIDEENAAKVREVFAMCIRGNSMNEIAKHFGVPRDRVFDALHNRVYTGMHKTGKGEWIAGRHPPIIDARTFAEAMGAIDRRRHGARSAHTQSRTSAWWLRDIARCALCGAKMSAAYGGNGGQYFRCYARCTSRYVSVAIAEAQCDKLVADHLIDMRVALSSSKRPNAPTQAAFDAEAARAKLQAKRERLTEAFVDGAITREQLRERLAALDVERMRIDARAEAPRVVTSEEKRRVLASVSEMRRAWKSATTGERRQIVNALAESVGIAATKEPAFAWFSIDTLVGRS